MKNDWTDAERAQYKKAVLEARAKMNLDIDRELAGLPPLVTQTATGNEVKAPKLIY